MEYIFGTIKRKGKMVDILKTVGDEHTNLTDNHTIERKYSDSNITDTFMVVDHYNTAESGGKCYDWYEISNHYRYIDYFTPQKESLIEEVTPYTDSKTAYIEDTEVTFADVPSGNLSLFMTDGDNQPVPCRYERINNDVRVMFEQRTSLATVTIQIS
jgi:hypothetical protein